MKQWYMVYKDPKSGAFVNVYATAQNINDARIMMEGQYGKANLISNPIQVN